jgi:hypothetical protein
LGLLLIPVAIDVYGKRLIAVDEDYRSTRREKRKREVLNS